MHVLFVHKNFPAQFGQIARYLVQREGVRCTFVTQREEGAIDGVCKVGYSPRSGARKQTHFCSRSFENYTWHSHAVYETLKAHPEIQPDLIVGHSGFGSTVFLADLYDCPIINYFEYYYSATGSDMDFRPEFPSGELERLRVRSRNAMLLLDLETCTAGYCPTRWQRSRFPQAYQPKLSTIFDGIDTAFWRRLSGKQIGPRRIGKMEIPADVKIVTYVSRGFESIRGFDIFMQIAGRICRMRRDVLFVCVGTDRICYGGDRKYSGDRSFRQYVLDQGDYDLSRFVFTGRVPPRQLVRILSLSDLHIYLTVPFILSWSAMNALACECTVLASDTAPVREMIRHNENGLLAGFYDIDAFVSLAMEVLDSPVEYARRLGVAGAQMVRDKYSLDQTMPQMLDLYHRTLSAVR